MQTRCNVQKTKFGIKAFFISIRIYRMLTFTAMKRTRYRSVLQEFIWVTCTNYGFDLLNDEKSPCIDIVLLAALEEYVLHLFQLIKIRYGSQVANGSHG